MPQSSLSSDARNWRSPSQPLPTTPSDNLRRMHPRSLAVPGRLSFLLPLVSLGRWASICTRTAGRHVERVQSSFQSVREDSAPSLCWQAARSGCPAQPEEAGRVSRCQSVEFPAVAATLTQLRRSETPIFRLLESRPIFHFMFSGENCLIGCDSTSHGSSASMPSKEGSYPHKSRDFPLFIPVRWSYNHSAQNTPLENWTILCELRIFRRGNLRVGFFVGRSLARAVRNCWRVVI